MNHIFLETESAGDKVVTLCVPCSILRAGNFCLQNTSCDGAVESELLPKNPMAETASALQHISFSYLSEHFCLEFFLFVTNFIKSTLAFIITCCKYFTLNKLAVMFNFCQFLHVLLLDFVSFSM